VSDLVPQKCRAYEVELEQSPRAAFMRNAIGNKLSRRVNAYRIDGRSCNLSLEVGDLLAGVEFAEVAKVVISDETAGGVTHGSEIKMR
jgi:hypothetical protein